MEFRFILCTILLLRIGSPAKSQSFDPKPLRILNQMFDTIDHIKTLRVKISALERGEKGYNSATSEIKLQTMPRKLYFVNKLKKVEILYNAEESTNKAWVKPNTFPYVSVRLDPNGSIMRKNQHYTINEMGFAFIGQALALTLSKDKEGLAHYRCVGKVIKNGYSCLLLEYENNSFTYTDYVVGEYQTVSSIALKLNVNDYVIRYKNNLLNNFSYLKKGTVLKVPVLYCRKAVIYVDEKLYLPVSISLYDDVGLFESYDFTGIVVNGPLKEIDFSKNNKAYGF